MSVESSLKLYMKIFRGFGFLPVEISKNKIIISKKSIYLCFLSFSILNLLLMYSSVKVSIQHERFIWRTYSNTGNIYRIFEMLILLGASLIINFWLIFHFKENVKVLRNIFKILYKIKLMHLKTDKYSILSKFLYFGYFVDFIFFCFSLAGMLSFVGLYKTNPDYFIESVEFFQRMIADATIKFTISCICTIGYCLNCVNNELSKNSLENSKNYYLRMRKFQNLMEVYVAVEPICDELNEIFGFPIAIIFCACFSTILSFILYFYTIVFSNWKTEIPYNDQFIALSTNIGLISPMVVSLVTLCKGNSLLGKEVSLYNNFKKHNS